MWLRSLETTAFDYFYSINTANMLTYWDDILSSIGESYMYVMRPWLQWSGGDYHSPELLALSHLHFTPLTVCTIQLCISSLPKRLPHQQQTSHFVIVRRIIVVFNLQSRKMYVIVELRIRHVLKIWDVWLLWLKCYV